MSSAIPERRLLLVHAHPDDESLTTGGTIARYSSEPDTSVTLVTCTLGEQGEVIGDELALLAADAADQLGGYRIGELAAACAALGLPPGSHRYLGGVGRWRDSGMVATGDGIRAATPDELHPRAFARPEAFDEQVGQLRAVLDEVRPQVVVSYDPLGGYGHPDHVRAHEITMAACRDAPSVRKVYWIAVPRSELSAGLAALEAASGLPYPLPGLDELPSVPDSAVTTRVDITAVVPAKVAALRAHGTQVSVWAAAGHTAYALSNGVAQPVLGAECYSLVDDQSGGDVSDGDESGGDEDDLFAGTGTR